MVALRALAAAPYKVHMLDEDIKSDTAAQRARALAAEGRYRDAIALGRTLTRDAMTAALEREMRDWRNRAFYETATYHARSDWPPAYADPFPDHIDRIPEIDAARLDAALLGGALHHHGSLIVRRLLPSAKAAACVAAIDRAFEAREKVEGDTQSKYAPLKPVHGPDLNDDRSFMGEMSLLLADAPSFLSGWLDELEACGVLSAVTDYLGERPALSATKGTLYRIPALQRAEWHQDGAFLNKQTRTVNLWVAATECGVDAPGLDIVPWRLNEIVRTHTHGTPFDWSVGAGQVEELAAGRAIATPHFMPGDAILFDQLCLHRTGTRPHMTRGRYAIETWMFAPSHYRESAPLII